MRRWTINDSKQLEKLLAQGVSQRQIAKGMRWSHNTIKDHVKRRNMKVAPKIQNFWGPEQTCIAIRMRSDGHTLEEIAKVTGFCVNTVKTYLPPGVDRKEGPIVRRVKSLSLDRARPVPSVLAKTPPRTIMNSSMREPAPRDTWQPTRPGAMDYRNIPSKGF